MSEVGSDWKVQFYKGIGLEVEFVQEADCQSWLQDQISQSEQRVGFSPKHPQASQSRVGMYQTTLKKQNCRNLADKKMQEILLIRKL